MSPLVTSSMTSLLLLNLHNLLIEKFCDTKKNLVKKIASRKIACYGKKDILREKIHFMGKKDIFRDEKGFAIKNCLDP